MRLNSKLARFGRPLCYILAIAFALSLILSTTAPQVAASPDKNWETPSAVSVSSELENLAGYVSYRDAGGITDEANFYDGDDDTSGYATNNYLENDNRVVIVWDSGTSVSCTIHFKHQAGDGSAPFTSYIETSMDNIIWITENTAAAGTTQTGDFTATFRWLRWRVLAPAVGGTGNNGLLYTIEGKFGAGNTTDDNTATQWRPNPENEVGAWINWDMGAVNGIKGARIYWGADANYRPSSYRIQTSTDNSSWTPVAYLKAAAPASAWMEYPWSKALARYVRLIIDVHGSSGTEIYEMDAEVNYSPTVENITVNNSLIDRDLDYAGSGAELTTTITIRVHDNDGSGEISAVYISIRDNEDNLTVDNVRVTDNTAVDENTLDFTYAYNPADNLSDSALGAFDINVVAEDNWGASDNNGWDGNGADLFTVDDLAMTVDLSPDNAYLGYAWGYDLTASGDISRISGSVSVDNSWLMDENAGQITLGASDSYSESYTITALAGTENIYVRVRALDSSLDGENYNYYDVNENRLYEIWVHWEETYGLVPDGDNENAIENRNYHLTFYYPTATQEFDMTTNPENFVAYATVEKIRIDVIPDNYWRTRIPPTPGVVNMILVDNIGDLDQYEFTLKDLTGQFGINDNGQLWFSRYIGDDLLYVHEDFWDAEDSVAAFLIYGKEYSLKLMTDTQERSYKELTADGILTKEISVSTFTMPDAEMIWDDIAWSTWWDNNDLKVSYQDNTSGTDNVTVNIYDENDELVSTEFFTTNEWTLTWTGANENLDYAVRLYIAHQTFGASTISTDILMPPWTPPMEEEGGIPGIGQLGTLPFAWGAGIGVVLVMIIALTFGARHAGFCVLTIGMFLVMMGPVMGLFRLNADPLIEWGFASFIIVMGVLMMLTKRGG